MLGIRDELRYNDLHHSLPPEPEEYPHARQIAAGHVRRRWP
jgi:hypothetical protein